MNPKKNPKTFIALLLLLVAFAVSYSWTYTPFGKLDYRAALSLHLLSFEMAYQPDPNSDFEFNLPINLIYPLSAMLPKDPVSKVQDVTIPGDGVDIPARIYWPDTKATMEPPPPLIVYYHGGGFVVGSVEIFDPLTRSLADTTKAIVISVDYRLAPAHPFPAALNDCYAALEWAAQNATSLGADPNRLIVGGDSAGGNLAAVVALKARDLGNPTLAGQILYYPAVDLSDKSYPSELNFTDGYGLSSEARAAFRQSYVGNIDDKTNPYISPLYANSLANLPPALVVTAGFDPLTDATLIYNQRLKQEGVSVTAHHYPEIIHGFMSVQLFSEQREALNATKAFVAKLK